MLLSFYSAPRTQWTVYSYPFRDNGPVGAHAILQYRQHFPIYACFDAVDGVRFTRIFVFRFHFQFSSL